MRAHLAASLMLVASVSTASADTVTSLGVPPNWSTLGTGSGGSATISTDQPRSGTGSAKLETAGGGQKAAVTFGGNRFGGPSLGTFADLLAGSLGFEFYRDGASDVAGHLAPALEVSFNNGANLKWEATYNGLGTITEDTWYSVALDHDSGLFWQYNGAAVEAPGLQNLTLDQWLNSTAGNDFTLATVVTGISVQAGSGWSGNFVGYVDNVYMNLGGTNISANFEPAPVPLPAAALGAVPLLGLVALRRRRKDRADA